MQLNKFQKLTTQDRVINQIQDNLNKVLTPLLGQTLNSGSILSNVALISGANSVNHLLGRPLQGWFVTRLRASASIYDTQDANMTPTLTLDLVSSAPVTVDLFVF